MKNAINYYYDLYPINIYQSNHCYKFTIDDIEYSLIQYNNEIKQLKIAYELNNLLRQYNIYCHQIVENKQNELATNINNKYFVLLKLAKFQDEKINLNSIMYYPIVTSNIHLENIIPQKKWRDLWIEKIDYFEYQVLNFKKKFPLINRTSNYYIGLAENAIQLLLEVPAINTFCISHHRIKKDYTLFDLYNPLEFTIDSKIRDAAEYFKTSFFYNNLNIEEVKYYVDNILMDNYDSIMFFSRLLYPSYYLDLCEKIIYNEQNENTLSEILLKNEEYEIFLKEILLYMKRKFQIPEIEWLKKS